jgi:hypothetical protein
MQGEREDRFQQLFSEEFPGLPMLYDLWETCYNAARSVRIPCQEDTGDTFEGKELATFGDSRYVAYYLMKNMWALAFSARGGKRDDYVLVFNMEAYEDVIIVWTVPEASDDRTIPAHIMNVFTEATQENLNDEVTNLWFPNYPGRKKLAVVFSCRTEGILDLIMKFVENNDLEIVSTGPWDDNSSYDYPQDEKA